jgi:hypothetical protein
MRPAPKLPSELPLPVKSTDFTSRLRGPQVTARVGLWLGVCFGIAFVTGVWSHYAQSTPAWLTMPTRPVNLYRVTQGLHIVAGSVAVPLLLVKLWSVYPRLFLPVLLRPSRATVLQALERISILVLVAAGIFQLVTGLMNSAQWYPWAFSFRSVHFAVAWVAIGALLVHIAVKLPVIRRTFAEPVDAGEDRDDRPDPPPGSPAGSPSGSSAGSPPLSRRALLRSTWLAAGLAALTTAGASVPLLRDVSVFAVRTGSGPQGVPINRTASMAGVSPDMVGAGWRLELVNGSRTATLTRADLAAMPQHVESLPIACVEGWSAGATWTGVRVRDLLALVGADPGDGAVVTVTSLQQRYAFGTSVLQSNFAADHKTLLALEINGETLSLDHGYPARLIAPNRPGVLQTKWVTRMEVSA